MLHPHDLIILSGSLLLLTPFMHFAHLPASFLPAMSILFSVSVSFVLFLHLVFLIYIKNFLSYLFWVCVWERERERDWGKGRERRRERISNRFLPVSTEPTQHGAWTHKREIMTCAEVGCLTDWATQALLFCFLYFICKWDHATFVFLCLQSPSWICTIGKGLWILISH